MTLPGDDGAFPAEPAPRRRWRLLVAGGAVLVLALFAAAVWYAYRLGVDAGTDADVPLIAADPGPAKIRPADPGGLEVPHQDVTVYQRFAQQPVKPVEEQLLPGPEQPLPKPPPPAAPPLAVLPPAGSLPPAAQPEAKPSSPLPDSPAALPQPAPPGSAPSAPAPQAALPPPAAAPAPQAQQPPAQAPAAGGYRVQVASLRSEADAKEAWSRLRNAHPDLLGRLQLHLVRVDLGGGKGVYHRVQAGPLSEKALADMVCGELKNRNVGCIVVQP